MVIKDILPYLFALLGYVNAKYENSETEIPPLEPLNIKLSPESFWEDFQNYSDTQELLQTWKTSRLALRDSDSGDVKKMYPATWSLQEPYFLKSFKNDKCLDLETAQSTAMIGRILPHPLTIGNGNKLIVQYEVQLQWNLNCGGAFVKLLPPMNESDLPRYGHGSVPFEMVFGPDKCEPYTNEIHLGLKKTNPKTHKPEVSILTNAPISRLEGDKTVRLYTLIMDSTNQDFEIRVDGIVVKSGNLLTEGLFEPSFQAPKKVADLDAKKPKDWDDRELIPDLDASKPDYWDEDEPLMIPDETDVKPDTWDEKLSPYIPDPNRSKPEWWKEDEDGEWVAPLVHNPQCFDIAGCGPWKQRMIENPDYWGPWTAPLIPNPKYKGKWTPPLVDNPDYVENLEPSNLENPIGVILFEFWSGSKDLLIDNLYIGHYVEEAELLGNKTFVPKKELQNRQVEAEVISQRGRIQQPKKPPTMFDNKPNLFDKLVDYGELLVEKFGQQGPITQSIIASILAIVLLLITTYLYLKIAIYQVFGSDDGGDSKAQQKPQEKQSRPSDSKFEELAFEPHLERIDPDEVELEKKLVSENSDDLNLIRRKSK